MNTKTPKTPRKHYTIRVHFENGWMDSAEYPSKAAALRDVPNMRAAYPWKRITVEPVNC